MDIAGSWLCKSTSTIDLQAQVMNRTHTQPKGLSSPPLSSKSPTSRTSRSSSASHSVSAGTESSRNRSTPALTNSRPRRGSITIRKLLSLSGLRNSSFSFPTSQDTAPAPSASASASSPSLPHQYHTSQAQPIGSRPESRGIKRAASSLLPSLVQDESRPQTQGDMTHKRKSTGWFRRTSQMFTGAEFTNQFNQGTTHDSINRQPLVISRPISQLPQDPLIVKNARVTRNFTAPEAQNYSYQSRPKTSIECLQRPEFFEISREREIPRTSHGFSSKESLAAPKLPELDAIHGTGGFIDMDMLSTIGR